MSSWGEHRPGHHSTIDCCSAEELIGIKDSIPSPAFSCIPGACGDPPCRRLRRIWSWQQQLVTAALAPGQVTRAAEAGYVEAPIRAFAIATAFWGVVGFLVGVAIAAQLAFRS